MKCRVCQRELAAGYLCSGMSIDWFFHDDSLIKKTLAMGKRISPGMFLSSGEVKGQYCQTCKTITLTDVDLKRRKETDETADASDQ